MTPQELRQTYKTLFATNDGEIVLEDLRTRFHGDQPTFSSDALEMAYLEGQRSVVLIIKNMTKDLDHNIMEMMNDV
tara:strand:- start:182 stop:409 length:228 start_codon:yes stop_codon:yes gene_type:complete